MLFFLITLFAAAFFAFIVTRPGMRILNELCPHYFDRIDEVVMMGFDGLVTYDPEMGRDSEEELQFEAHLLLPLMYASATFAVVQSWVTAMMGYSTFGCIIASFLGSLVPFAFGLLLLGAGALLVRFQYLVCRITGDTGEYDSSTTSADEPFVSGTTEPTTLVDRAYDYVIDRKEELQQFSKNPRSLLDVLDDLYDAARARFMRFLGRRG